MISRIGKSQNEENKDKFACYGHIYNLRGCPHLGPGNQCLGTGTKRCCVHTESTRYSTAYIVTPFLPVSRHFFKIMSLATITKPWTATELKKKNGVHTGTRCPLLCPSTRSRPWVLRKRVCSHQCPASGVPGHRVRVPSVNDALVNVHVLPLPYPKLLHSSYGCLAVIPDFYHGNCHGFVKHHIY